LFKDFSLRVGIDLSLVERKWGKKIHYVFKMRGPKELYLGPKEKPNPERVKEALQYVEQLESEYVRHYDELKDRLSTLLKQRAS